MIESSNELLVIGAGPSADTPEVAAAAAKAHRVMRINHFPPGKHLGTRCDIWGTSAQHHVAAPATRPAEIWWTGWPRPCWSPGFEPARITRTADRQFVGFLAQLLHPKHPSTGLVCVHMAIQAGYKVFVAGFDHFLGEFHYWAEETERDRAIRADMPKWHNPEGERLLFELLFATGQIRRLPGIS
jgi:hypothetical protein